MMGYRLMAMSGRYEIGGSGGEHEGWLRAEAAASSDKVGLGEVSVNHVSVPPTTYEIRGSEPTLLNRVVVPRIP